VRNQYYEIYDKVENKEFYERYHSKEDENQFYNLEFDSLGIKLSYVFGKNENGTGITLSTQKDCSLYIEVKTKDNQHSSFNLDLKKNKNEEIPVSSDDFKIKIVLEEDLLFRNFHIRKRNYCKEIKDCYNLEYFISDIFKELYLKEAGFDEQHFGLMDREPKNFAEKLLKKYFLMSVRKSTKNFIEFSRMYCLNIWLNNFERIFSNFPLLVSKIKNVVENFFQPKFEKLKESIRSDFYAVGFLNSMDPSYVLRISIMKDMIENDKKIEEANYYSRFLVKDTNFEQIKQIYNQDVKIYTQALRIWSFWELACSRIIDCTVNKIPLFLIDEPIKELRDEVWDMVYQMDEKELQNIVNSKDIINQRRILKKEIASLEESVNKIRSSLIENNAIQVRDNGVNDKSLILESEHDDEEEQDHQ
jgi:hypothetical protein